MLKLKEGTMAESEPQFCKERYIRRGEGVSLLPGGISCGFVGLKNTCITKDGQK